MKSMNTTMSGLFISFEGIDGALYAVSEFCKLF